MKNSWGDVILLTQETPTAEEEVGSPVSPIFHALVAKMRAALIRCRSPYRA